MDNEGLMFALEINHTPLCPAGHLPHTGGDRYAQPFCHTLADGWTVVRFWNDDVLRDLDGVCLHVLTVIEEIAHD